MKRGFVYLYISSLIVIVSVSCKTRPNSPAQAELKILHGSKASESGYNHPGIVKLNFYQLKQRSNTEIEKQPIRPLNDALTKEKLVSAWICTASFMSESIAVTAAHCFHHLPSSEVGENLIILLTDQHGDVVNTANGGPALVTKAKINDQYNIEGSDMDNVAHDLALVYCNGVHSIETFNISSELSAQVGDEVTLFGYGQISLDKKTTDVLMMGKNTLADITPDTLLLKGSTKNDEGGAMGLEGDSGSPLLDGNGIIIGIASVKIQNEQKYPGKIFNFYMNVTNSSSKRLLNTRNLR